MEDLSQPVVHRRRKPKLRVSTLKRLTAIPAHKVRHDNRHFPGGVAMTAGHGAGGALALLKGDGTRPGDASRDEDEDKAGPAESANERRKKFLTMSNLKRVFRALDLSDDGYIDVDELHEAQKKLGGKLSRDEIEDVIWEVDDDRDGRLSMADYLTSYRRTQSDEYGFEPKRFYAIVEFLLMDRDCSGEISVDEAMTTIFERQGADNLKEVTQDFFRAAGLNPGEDPPPGATITFSDYYAKVGCAKPRVPSINDTRRTYSTKLFTETFGHAPAKLRPSASAGLLPRLLSPPKRPHSVPNPLASSSSAAALLGRAKPNALSPLGRGAPAWGSALGGGKGGGGRERSPLRDSNSKLRPATVDGATPSRRSPTRKSSSGALSPLKPITATSASQLALSAIAKTGHSATVERYKDLAAGALHIRPDIA